MWVLFLLDIRKNIRIRGYLYPADHISDAHPLTEIFASESVSGKIYIRIRIREKIWDYLYPSVSDPVSSLGTDPTIFCTGPTKIASESTIFLVPADTAYLILLDERFLFFPTTIKVILFYL